MHFPVGCCLVMIDRSFLDTTLVTIKAFREGDSRSKIKARLDLVGRSNPGYDTARLGNLTSHLTCWTTIRRRAMVRGLIVRRIDHRHGRLVVPCSVIVTVVKYEKSDTGSIE